MPIVRTETIPKERSRIYLGKAGEFLTAATTALGAGDTNASASAAAHAVISACDALVAHHLGLRCKGEDHREVVQLLGRTGLPEIRGKAVQIYRVLDVKRVAEYEDRNVTPAEAQMAEESARRILGWVRGNLPAS